MKLTESVIKTTVNNLQSITTNIEIAKNSAGQNNVSMEYNTNYKVYTVKNNGVEYYATNRKKAIELYYRELYLIKTN